MLWRLKGFKKTRNHRLVPAVSRQGYVLTSPYLLPWQLACAALSKVITGIKITSRNCCNFFTELSKQSKFTRPTSFHEDVSSGILLVSC